MKIVLSAYINLKNRTEGPTDQQRNQAPYLELKTRLDTRQDSRGRLGKGRNAKNTQNEKDVMDRLMDGAMDELTNSEL